MSTFSKIGLQLVALESLRPHEKILEDSVRALADTIIAESCQKCPIIIDRASRVILDGHHRVAALKSLGLRRIGAVCVDYLCDSEIVLDSWRSGIYVTKADVLLAGATGKLFEYKTTKHHLLNFDIKSVCGWALSELSL